MLILPLNFTIAQEALFSYSFPNFNSLVLLIITGYKFTYVPCLYGENVPRVEVLIVELPWASQLFLGFLTKLGEPFE